MTTSSTNLIDNKSRRLGAWVDNEGAGFRLWAPKAERVEVLFDGADGKQSIKMEKLDRGYFEARAPKGKAGDKYQFQLNGKTKIPDPASRYQPEGPHGPSQILGHDYKWTDVNWKGLPLSELVIYELHVGTFSPEGTFEGVRKKLQHFKDLGINAIEIMPVAQFAGKRNWGYDGVGLFAAQNTYGVMNGPADDIAPLQLKRLVDACHAEGIAVLLDVVYNHLGPEGNYLPQLGPYFQSKYKTPWGDALNYDGDWSDEVRRYFLENARQWLEEFHFDGLRLDAVHAIFDTSARPFLEDLSTLKNELQTQLGRPLYIIAESDANDSRILREPARGGLGMDGQWADDLHHTIHAAITGEQNGYYADYGKIEQFAAAYQEGVIFHGEYSEFRHRSFGRSYEGINRSRLVVCSQNHDQIGNRMNGDRLMSLVGPEKARLAAACVFLTENLPLMFMGEEFAETNPFQYFVDHTDKELLEAVSRGRKAEFASFHGEGEAPDPASQETFERSKLNWNRLVDKSKDSSTAQSFMTYYRQLIHLSKWIRREKLLEKGNVKTELLAEGRVLKVVGRSLNNEIQIYLSFSSKVEKVLPEPTQGKLEILLNSAEDKDFSRANQAVPELSKETIRESIELKPYAALALRVSGRN